MARTELLAQSRLYRQGQEASRRSDTAVLHDDGPVVKRNGGVENRHQQIVGKRGVERDAALNVSFEADITLDDNQSAGLIGSQGGHGQDDFVIHFVSVNARKSSEQRRLSETREGASDFVLKHYD